MNGVTMNKIKLFLPVILFSLLFSISFMAFATSGDGCDGCKRTAVLMGISEDIDLNSFRSRLAERVTNPCFRLLYSGEITELGTPFKWKSPEGSPEYYFTASYETNLKGQIKSRLSVSLYFEDGELIHNWKTESESPIVTFHWHLQNMFIAQSALFRKWIPLDITLLNDFEKQPSQCDVHPDKEELFPGQEIQVKISNIVDFEGRKSREFNRIVVQAVNGEIVGGTPLASDPELKAFQVGKEDITFTYIAPDNEDSQATEDKIIIYNSCDILRKDEYPMPKTGLKDKIAEKKISLIRADAEATITSIYKVHTETHERGERSTDDEEVSSEIKVTIKAYFEYDDTYSDEDEYEEQYDLTSWQILTFNGNLEGHSRHFDWSDGCEPTRCTFERLQDSEARAVNFSKQEGAGVGMSIIFNAKTGKATEVNTCAFPVDYTWAEKMKETETYEEPSGTRVYNEQYDFNQKTFFYFNSVGPYPEMTEAKSGDGVHEIGGGGTYIFTPGYDQLSVKWEVVRHRK